MYVPLVFRKKAHRQSLAVATSQLANEDQSFFDALSELQLDETPSPCTPARWMLPNIKNKPPAKRGVGPFSDELWSQVILKTRSG